jgi:hypothetical protein
MPDPSSEPKYKNLEVHRATYKEVKGHGIDVNILIPKSLISNPLSSTAQKKIPLIIRFHGGGLV